MNDIFGGQYKENPDFQKLEKEVTKKIDKYVQHIRNYQFPIQIIQENGYKIVAEIFARVNSQGTQLTGAEIHLASIIPFWQGISAEFRQYRMEQRKIGYDFDLTFLMRAITVIACDVPQIKKLADKIAHESLNKQKLNKIWSESKRAINAVNKSLQNKLWAS